MTPVLTSGNVPPSCQIMFFRMRPKTSATKSVSDFRPIAHARLLYKLFAYLMLGRMDDSLEARNRKNNTVFGKEHELRSIF